MDETDSSDVIFELSAEIDELKARIAALERFIESLLPEVPTLRLPNIPEMRV